MIQQRIKEIAAQINHDLAKEKPLFIGSTVSANERWLLFSQIDQTGADLMMVENFK